MTFLKRVNQLILKITILSILTLMICKKSQISYNIPLGTKIILSPALKPAYFRLRFL
jgi:hypothetical protein